MHLTPRGLIVAFMALAFLYAGVLQLQHHAEKKCRVKDDQVCWVSDGDTINVQGHGPVRILLVDAPETHDNSHGDKGCYGQTAKRYVQELLPPGTPVKLVFDSNQKTEKSKKDRYQRVLAYVEKVDGTDVGEKLLGQGFAEIYNPGWNRNRDRLGRYQKVAAAAERAERGIWGPECAP